MAQEQLGVRLGAHATVNPFNPDAREERLGVHLSVPVLELLEVSPSLSRYRGDAFDEGAWQFAGSIRIRPFGPGTPSPYYVGVGASVLHHGEGALLYDLAVVCVECHAFGLQTFAEALHYGMFDEGPTRGGGLSFGVGVNVSL